jgi:riboflavin kinase / FMN adenylyltransferase
MIELAWPDLPGSGLRNRAAAVTIGVFDGVHTGHQVLLSTIMGNPGLLPVVVTFERHPAEVLAPGTFSGLIMSLAQKREAFLRLGVGVLVQIDFSLEFSRLSGPEFLQTLMSSFDLRFAGIGHDFRCGHEMTMEGEEVKSFLVAGGVRVNLVQAVRAETGIVSSTRIRESVRTGKLDVAHRLLGRPFTLDVSGETVEHDGPEVRIPLDSRGLLPASRQIVPPPGKYRAAVASGATEEQTTIAIDDNSLRLPLAPGSRIRYIVLQENRVF